MEIKYFLIFKKECIDLFSSSELINSERQFIEKLDTLKINQRQLIELKIQLIFSKFEIKSNESRYWKDNLKTLLAYDFNIVRSSDNHKLVKSFYPLRFKLCLDGFQDIHFGCFHMMSGQSITIQFIKFCKVAEYPVGISKHIITNALLRHSGHLDAIQSDETTQLIRYSRTTGIISGKPSVLNYFLDAPSNFIDDILNQRKFGSDS